MMFGVEDWITDEERRLLDITFPVKDLNMACYAVYFVSLLRRSRAPEQFENMMILAAGNNWADMYLDEFVKCVRSPTEIYVHEGSILMEGVPRD